MFLAQFLAQTRQEWNILLTEHLIRGHGFSCWLLRDPETLTNTVQIFCPCFTVNNTLSAELLSWEIEKMSTEHSLMSVGYLSSLYQIWTCFYDSLGDSNEVYGWTNQVNERDPQRNQDSEVLCLGEGLPGAGARLQGEGAQRPEEVPGPLLHLHRLFQLLILPGKYCEI